MPDPSLTPNTLKRPRSTSNPPSPTASSSSKKAASEEVVTPSLGYEGRVSDTAATASQLLSASMNGNGANRPGSSPLRADGDEESDAWVKRTEDVHLDESMGMNKGLGKDKYAELYNLILSSSPPPFTLLERYYLYPIALMESLKNAAYSQDDSEPSVQTVKLDMSPLLEDTEGEEVYVIETQAMKNGEVSYAPKGKRERVWLLKAGLQELDDFGFISEEGWKTISSALGAENGPSLSRLCISGERIQLSPPIYTLHHVPPPSSSSSTASAAPIRFTCPADTPIPIFIRLLRSLLIAESAEIDKEGAYRAWQFEARLVEENNDITAKSAIQFRDFPPTLLPALASKIVASSGEKVTRDTTASRNFEDGDSFILEFGKKLGGDQTDWVLDVSPSGEAVVKPTVNLPPVPTAPKSLFSQPPKYGGTASTAAESSTSGASLGMTTRGQAKRSTKSRGLVGLVNLGNTCFMNSATQCLSNTVELCDYFYSGVYREELNRDNPLGMYGQVAEAFGGVVEALWSPSAVSSFSPRQLKHTTSRFAPQFAGYGQHDTQEFIAFLLDGLHEDLNRIKKKPYIEKPDWKAGGGDRELAELGKECWGGYKQRNDSVIVDLFQGQLMSTLVCPECRKESITMDPFMYLTVPLPIAQYREFKYHFVPRDPEKPIMRGKVLVPANASFSQVKEKLGILMKCSPQHLIGFDLWKNGIYNWWLDSDHNGEAKEHDVAVFHDVGVPTASSRRSTGTLPTDGSITVPVFTYRVYDSGRSRGGGDIPMEGDLPPFFVNLSRAEAADASAVREAVAKGYARFVDPDVYGQMWVPSGSSAAAVPIVPDEDGGPLLGEAVGTGDGDVKVNEILVRSEGSEIGSRPQSPTQDVNAPTRIRNNASSASLATLASTKSGRVVPRGDLYQIHVADVSTTDGSTGLTGVNVFKSKDPVVPLYKGGDPRKASGGWSLLESRRKAKKNLLGRFTSGISSIVGSASTDEDSAPTSPTSGTKESTANPLVVRPGEAIFCGWPASTFADYFTQGRAEEEMIDPAIEREKAKKKEGKSITIEDCLDEFSKEETLGQEDLWYCPICKKHQAATKRLEIYKAPDILVICIKRFGSSRRLSDKLDNLVQFPITGLDLEERIGERRISKTLQLSESEAKEFGIDGGKESWVYDLYAVDNHFGGLGGGHYTAFCKNKEDGEWYNYDDSRVSKANEEAIQSRAAYLLFYRRRTVRPIGGISRVKAEEALSRNASRTASPAPASPAFGPVHSGLRNAFEPPSSSPAASPTSSSSDSLPAYSTQGNSSPTLSSPPRGENNLQLSVDSSEDEEDGLNFVRRGQPYGGTSWGGPGTSTGTSTAYTLHHPFGQTSGAPLSPPESEDGDFEHQRARTQSMMAGHPATEAVNAGAVDGEKTDTDVMVEDIGLGNDKEASRKQAGSGLGDGGEEYGEIRLETSGAGSLGNESS